MRRHLLAFISLFTCSMASVGFTQGYPAPKPSEPHKMFALEEGTWECRVRMYINGPANKPVEFRGTETNKRVSGGLFLLSEFTCPMGDQVFEGHGLMGYNPQQKQYTGTWVDNFTAAPSQFVGELDKDKRTFVLHSEVYDAATGENLKQMQITKWNSDSEKQFTIYLLVGDGDDAQKIKLMDMTAKKKEPRDDSKTNDAPSDK